MKLSTTSIMVLLLGTSPTAFAFQTTTTAAGVRHTSTTLAQTPLKMAKASSLVEAAVEFNTNFKQGLKYVLVPQSNNAKVASYYGPGELPAKVDVSDIIGTTATDAGGSVVAAQVVPEGFNHAAVATKTVMAVTPPPQVVVVPDIPAEIAMPHASTLTTAAYQLDPVVPKTVEKMKEAIDWSGLTSQFTDPSNRGLATPVVRYIQDTLHEVQASQAIPRKFLTDMGIRELPQEYETVKYGFQVNKAILDRWREIDWAELPASVPMDKFTMVIVNLQQLVKQDGWKFSDIIDALNLEELGGWYSGIVVGFLLLLALTERNTPRTSSSAAATAASYSTRAATSAGDAELRSMVTDLNKAVQALTQELKEMKAEKSLTDSALASMKTEVSGMKSQLAQSSATEMQLKKEIEKREADNVALRLKLSETNKEVVNLIEENALLTAAIVDMGGTLPTAEQMIQNKPPKTPPPRSKLKRAAQEIYFANVKEKDDHKRESSGIGADDWSNVSLATLKSKTEKELRTYLESLGISTTGKDGKPLEKDELMEYVMAVVAV